jgi:AraC-like DNA-binding protein
VSGNKLKESGFEIKLENEGHLARRKTSWLPDGLYLFEDELQINASLTTTVITCSGWLIEFFSLVSGEMFFWSGTQGIRPPANNFGILYPPFTITKPAFRDVEAHLVGVAGTARLPDEFAKFPLLFETNPTSRPQSFAQIIEILHSGRDRQIIEANPKASLLSLKAKKLIDENYLIYPSIARIAALLQVSHAHLTRRFKLDFAMTPNAYLHQLRMADANFRLAQGEKIISVSNEVGYNDLSRFYKHFRKSNTDSPGNCQNILRPENNIKKRQDF